MPNPFLPPVIRIADRLRWNTKPSAQFEYEDLRPFHLIVSGSIFWAVCYDTDENRSLILHILSDVVICRTAHRHLLFPLFSREYLAVATDAPVTEDKMTIRVDISNDMLERIELFDLAGSVNLNPIPALRGLGGPTENNGFHRYEAVIIRKAKRPGRGRMITQGT